MRATIIKINLSLNDCCLTLHRELQIIHLLHNVLASIFWYNNSGNSKMLSNMDKIIEYSPQLCKLEKNKCVLCLIIKGIVYYFFYGLLRVQEGSLTNCLAMAANVTLKSGLQAIKRIPEGLLKLDKIHLKGHL